MPAVSPYNPKGYTNATDSFPWKYVTGYTSPSASSPSKKVWMRNADNNGWLEVWNSSPLINTPTITSANDGVTYTKLTIAGTTDNLNIASTMSVTVTNTLTNATVTSSTVSFSALKGTQNYSFVITGLADNTLHNISISSSNAGGSSVLSTSATTNINCTEGSTGFVPISCSDCSETQSQGCGFCNLQYRTRTRTKYGKTGCVNTYYSSWSDWSVWGACTSNTSTWNTVSSAGTYTAYDANGLNPLTVTHMYDTTYFVEDSYGCNPGCTGGTCYSMATVALEKCSVTNYYRYSSYDCGCYC